MDLVVEGKAYINGIFQNCCIGIKDGKISAIKKILKGDEYIDFRNRLILPSGIDLHVHFRDPGLTNKEDFSTGSIAAAFGGISCVFDMPNTIPQTKTLQNLSDKISLAEKKSYVDFGIYAGITDDNLDSIEYLSKKCSGFKIYLGGTTNSLKFDKKNLRKALKIISKTEKLVLFHAEDDEKLIEYSDKENNLIDHLKSRPSVCEETSITDVIGALQGLGMKAHICHVSSIEGLEILKKRPNNITCGTTAHHCLLSIEKNMGSQTFFKVNPPIRSSFDKESLFNGIKNGLIDVIESDHAPHTKEEKNVSFNEAPSGLPGVETTFPIFLYLAKKEVISFQRIVSLLCERPAEILDIPKGKLEVGRNADFIVVDLRDDCRIKSDMLHSKCGWTPFEDWSAIFPIHVFLRGEKLIEDYEIQVSQGFGKFVGD
ncbi:MAG: dihydroorotase [Thermoplasmatales archaeon]|nr:MAG: dihydroorotase [Thermoplasmatales archaeon]